MLSNRQKYGMLAAGTAAFLVLGLMYAWSVLRIRIVAAFPDYTATQMSLCFTLTMSFFCIGGFLGGKLTERTRPALTLRCAAALLLLGYGGASLMPALGSSGALALLYVCYSLLAGLGTGMAFNALMSNIAPWFPHRLGLCTGVMLMGFGLSSLLYALVIDALSERWQIFTLLRAFALLICAVVLLTSFLVRRPPSAAAGERKEPLLDGSVSPAQMLLRPSFWVYFIWNSVCGGAGLMIINNAANISAYFGLMAGLGMVVNVFNGCGRPFVGALVDRFGQYKSMLIMSAMLILAAVCLLLADTGAGSWLMFLGLVAVGVVYGGGSTISTKVIRDLYGPAHFGVNHSIANFCVIGGSLVGPLLSGVLQDRSAGGFTSTFITLLCMGAAELLLLGALLLTVKRERRAADS